MVITNMVAAIMLNFSGPLNLDLLCSQRTAVATIAAAEITRAVADSQIASS